jgi:hypothetical protein
MRRLAVAALGVAFWAATDKETQGLLILLTLVGVLQPAAGRALRRPGRRVRPRSRARPGAPRRPCVGPGVRTLPRSVRSSSRRADPAVFVTVTPLSAVELNATASVPGTFVDTPAAGTIPGVGSGPVVTVTSTPAAATNSTTATASVRIDVAAA